MKKILSAVAALVVVSAAASAFAASATPSISMLYRSTTTAAVNQDLSFKLTRDPAKAGNYSAADMGFTAAFDSRLITPARVELTGDAATAVDISYPASVTLSNGGDTAVMAIKAYGKTAAVTDPTDAGATVSTNGAFSNAVTGADGKFYVTLAPNGIVFSADTPGNWTGSAPVQVDYSL